MKMSVRWLLRHQVSLVATQQINFEQMYSCIDMLLSRSQKRYVTLMKNNLSNFSLTTNEVDDLVYYKFVYMYLNVHLVEVKYASKTSVAMSLFAGIHTKLNINYLRDALSNVMDKNRWDLIQRSSLEKKLMPH